ncbi:MAG: glycosyltransferase family 2 protein [Thermodesulfobacteriota bacterium]
MTKTKPTISVIVPAYNEEQNLEGAVKCIYSALGKNFSDHEILIFNDFSTDGTGKLADRLAKKDKHLRIIHNPTNKGFGYNYKEGVRLATKEFVIMVPGDNEIPDAAIKKIFTLVGKADIVVPYTANQWVRPRSRQIVSKLFVVLMNLLTGLDLTYYNGTCVLKSSAVKNIDINTHGFAYMATILTKLIKSGASYTEVGVDIILRETGESKAFSPRNIVSVLKALFDLFVEVRITNWAKYNKRPKKVVV